MSRKRRDLARTLVYTSITFAVVLVLQLCGWLGAGDDLVHRLYFRWSPARQSAHRVIVLSVDPDSPGQDAKAWNPEKLRAALSSVMQGNPSVVALVDPEESLSLSPEQLSAIIQDPANHQRVVSASSKTYSLGGLTGVTSIGSGDLAQGKDRSNVLEVVSKHIAQSRLKTGPFPIHYFKSRESLPKIPLWTLLSNNTQRSSFQGNVVLIGATKGPKAKIHNTPVGPMSSLEVHAHAVSGLIDSVTWEQPKLAHARVFLFFFLLAWCYRLSKHKRPGALREALALSAACVALDALLFHKSILLWGPLAPLAGIWIAQFIALRGSLLTVTNKVGYLQTRLAEMLPEAIAEKKQAKKDLVDKAFWQDLVDFGRGYLQLDFEGMIAELPEKEWHIQFRASTGSSTREIAEQRRDIRRAPFRSPFLTQRCGWAKNFVHNREFSKSLVVPLHHQSKLFGYWLLHMRESQVLDDAFLRTCEALGRQMASVIAQQRGQQESQEDSEVNCGQLAVLEVERDVKRLERERNWAMQVIEQDPDPILMASLWGPIELMNEQMRERVGLLFPAGIPDNDVRAVIAKLCGGNQAQVQTLMRTAVVDQGNVPVPECPDEHETFVQGDYCYFLRSIAVGQSPSQEQGVPDINQVRILLVAKDRYEAPRIIESIQSLDSQPISVPTQDFSANEGPPTRVYKASANDTAIIQGSEHARCGPDNPSPPALDDEPKTCRIAAPEPYLDHEAIEQAPALHADEAVYYEDGWEDWTPQIQEDPRKDLALPSPKRAAS